MRAWAWAGVGLLTLQIALGGLTSANHAGTACPQLLGCDVAGASWRAFDPWRDLGAGALPAADAAWLQLAHRAVAVAAAGVILVLVWQVWPRDRRSGAAVLGLLALQATSGAVQVLVGLPMAAALLHNLLAALLLAAVARLASSEGAPQTITGSGSSRMPKRP
jgi:heme a synthase